MRISRVVDGRTLAHAECRYCGHTIVEVTDVGWVDPVPDSTYDLCASNWCGDHEPSDEAE